jgi:hypothetical protein
MAPKGLRELARDRTLRGTLREHARDKTARPWFLRGHGSEVRGKIR